MYIIRLVILWRTVLRHLTLMYISQYPPPDIGNFFCLVVRIFGSEPKGPRFYPRRQSGDSRTKNTQQQLSVPLIDGSIKNQVNSIFCYIHQMAALKLLQQRNSPNSKPMTHFIAQKPVSHFIAQNPVSHFSAQNDECTTSADCDTGRGLCCQVLRRHRMASKKLCHYFLDPKSCIGEVQTTLQELKYVPNPFFKARLG
ncbi:hypothetical protein AVEN_264960-1 [Araneus ventricosus]|uniref:SOCS box domain-containing protein n=1 Tax=Araneus ventricosus TaxID=182803 RepID=A0A4Y2B613_ARAVE|nr:hypothetical protein AVEN_264960-1 [Araneus ventricosus]